MHRDQQLSCSASTENEDSLLSATEDRNLKDLLNRLRAGSYTFGL